MDTIETELRRRLNERSRRVREVLDSSEIRQEPGGLRAALREAVQRRETAQHQLDHHLRTRTRPGGDARHVNVAG
ncbi:hypothetical protein BH20ACT6_BH20ACT6_12070 [soil metagenome]